ncbi:DUF2948 family protein [Rhodospirillaceae bacterium SYSU D60014]|uniref:DUF2948 family protein n=1 Tax=Virgifigura deserti TaxID=2268457 RepID=UPI000E66675E
MSDVLKLRARDKEDFGVIAALLQDALLPISEMAYLPDEKRFVMVLNRYRWEAENPAARGAVPSEPAESPSAEDASFEDEAAPSPYFERVHCGVCFDRVLAVRTRGIEQRARDQILELLTAQAEDRSVLLVFAGNAAVRLEVEALHCHLEDLGEAWPTRWRPQHSLEDGGEDR